jgi:hypothetical protein
MNVYCPTSFINKTVSYRWEFAAYEVLEGAGTVTARLIREGYLAATTTVCKYGVVPLRPTPVRPHCLQTMTLLFANNGVYSVAFIWTKWHWTKWQ